ncbi:VWA domain-containing protein [Kiritimatiellaeota bacterium B1221]|nr:VWA domain-containing protein [Kiritimatiellaeota bacterium B1221]
MSFGTPALLWALPLLILLGAIDLWMRHQRTKKLNRFLPEALRERMGAPGKKNQRNLRSVLFYAGIFLIGFSLSRPQWGFSWREAQREGLDLLVMVDTSNSMRADDFKPTRLQRAQWGIEDLIEEVQGDRIGLIAFAGEGVLQCPLTLDYGAFMMNVQDLFPGIVPVGGTNLQAALNKALDSFDAESEADKVILLITDGESHQGNLTPVFKKLKEENIRVFSVGVGTPEGSLIPMDASATSFLKNRQQEVVKSNLNEKVLQQLASETDGLYVKANPRDFGVAEIITEGLKPLKRAQLESERVKEMEERFQLFLLLGLGCLLLEALTPLPALWLTGRQQA